MMSAAKSIASWSMAPRMVAARKRNGLVFEYSQELDALRGKYGYAVGDPENGPLWFAGSRVPAVHRKRMVKLMRYIDRVLGVEACRWYWQQAPTLERYSWRCMYTPLDGSAGHLWKTRCSSLYQLAHKA